MSKATKIFKKIILWSLIIFFGAFLVMEILGFVVYYFDFMRTDIVSMIAWERHHVSMDIPVRYKDGDITRLPGLRIYTKNGWNYSLRRDESSGEMWLAICRWGLGGWAVYTARYEITDDNVKQKLLQLWNEHYKESSVKVE